MGGGALQLAEVSLAALNLSWAGMMVMTCCLSLNYKKPCL
ncbi:hypothetical protein IMCC1989_148 [gamma proteobacterium IMCC1989]|nr:hypothetical protein IMCC1989_148 [gamma proteobacterium IMCC1989]